MRAGELKTDLHSIIFNNSNQPTSDAMSTEPQTNTTTETQKPKKTRKQMKPRCPDCKVNDQVVRNGHNMYGGQKCYCRNCKKMFTAYPAKKKEPQK